MAARANAVRAGNPRPKTKGETRSAPSAMGPSSPQPEQTRLHDQVPACIRQDMIEQAAYSLAEKRGFASGHELEDWLAAEIEVDTMIRERYR